MKIFFRLKHSVANPTDNRDFRKLHKNSFFLHPKLLHIFKAKSKDWEKIQTAPLVLQGEAPWTSEKTIASENDYNTHTRLNSLEIVLWAHSKWRKFIWEITLYLRRNCKGHRHSKLLSLLQPSPAPAPTKWDRRSLLGKCAPARSAPSSRTPSQGLQPVSGRGRAPAFLTPPAVRCRGCAPGEHSRRMETPSPWALTHGAEALPSHRAVERGVLTTLSPAHIPRGRGKPRRTEATTRAQGLLRGRCVALWEADRSPCSGAAAQRFAQRGRTESSDAPPEGTGFTWNGVWRSPNSLVLLNTAAILVANN